MRCCVGRVEVYMDVGVCVAVCIRAWVWMVCIVGTAIWGPEAAGGYKASFGLQQVEGGLGGVAVQAEVSCEMHGERRHLREPGGASHAREKGGDWGRSAKKLQKC